MRMDLSAMLVEAAGTAFPGGRRPDGRSLLSADFSDRAMFWRYKRVDQAACRLGSYKYLAIAGNEFLFDLTADPLERADLKDRRRDIFDDLKRRCADWNATMLPHRDDTFTHGLHGDELADHFGVN